MANEWDDVAVGEAGGFRVAVVCSRDEPSKWATVIDTALLHLWLEMPDHGIPHRVLSFFEQTRGKKFPVRLDVPVGTFHGRTVRLTKNEDDERYFLASLPTPTSDASNGSFFLRLKEDAVADVVAAVREVVDALDRSRRKL
jgi:hypothetical protein